MQCKKCKKHISPDCMLTSGTCVFCYYKTDKWDSNGQLVRKKDAIIPTKIMKEMHMLKKSSFSKNK